MYKGIRELKSTKRIAPGVLRSGIYNYNGLRTVYSHLSDIFVKEGQKVKALEPIGTVGESLGGSILHFEVWLNTDKQNPETWLSKR